MCRRAAPRKNPQYIVVYSQFCRFMRCKEEQRWSFTFSLCLLIYFWLHRNIIYDAYANHTILCSLLWFCSTYIDAVIFCIFWKENAHFAIWRSRKREYIYMRPSLNCQHRRTVLFFIQTFYCRLLNHISHFSGYLLPFIHFRL